MERPYLGAIDALEAVACRLHGHGNRILIPIADGALALGLGLEGGIEPAVGGGNGLPLQSQTGDIGAEG